MSKVLKADASVSSASVDEVFAFASEVWLSFQVYLETAVLTAYQVAGNYVALTDVDPNLILDIVAPADYGGDNWYGDTGSHPGTAPIPDAWMLIELHYNSADGTREFYLNGSLVFTEIGGLDGDAFRLTIGPDSFGSPGGPIYYDDVKLGTSRGASDIFADDFEDGTLDAWTSTSGDVSVIDNPFAPPTPTAPDAPTLDTADAEVDSVALTWTPGADGGAAITGYRVYRGLSPGVETLRASVGLVTSYVDPGDATVTYYYKVSAVNAVGESSLSNELSATPEILPPVQVFGGTRFYEAPPWRMIVGDLEDNTLTFLDKLALDRSVTVTRAAARVISGRVPSDNPEVNITAPPPDGSPFVSEGTRIVSCFRREAPQGSNEAPWVIRARGLVLSLDDDADSDHATSTFTAYDPWKYLYRRPVLQTDGSAGGVLGDVSYVAGTRASEIIIDQLETALLSGGTIFTDFGQTAFYAGTIENTEPLPDGGDGLAMTFRSGTTLGEMLDLLVATGTCDVVFDPIYDIANRPGLLCELSVYEVAGAFKPNAVMGWDRWPRSLVGLSRQVEGTERANNVQMYAGQGGPPVPLEVDAASVTAFGEYWALQYLPGVPSLAGAHTIAQRQLQLLRNGLYTYTLSPASERAPLLFEEYREADTVPVYADERFRDPIGGVPVRVESIPIVIGDDSLERVNQMLVSFVPQVDL